MNIPKYILWYMNTHAKTLLTIKTDKTLKIGAQHVAEEIGVPLSTVVNAFLKQFVREREITFSASYEPTMYLRSIIREGESELKTGRGLSKKFHSAKDLMKGLSSKTRSI